ncbi:MAG: polysaccharide pyruvyl transferase family protein [Bacteroides sp.]|nr:polysaccharide pyruvyl transferase family protein [Bacteroides sp.]MCM1379907.1 polysaccharide pyruvyl transferase family protein [Bacteroides sp.]MCM1446239.1 polysaccharide pyruvyl transferase family protein [Prevotella sp.]
MKTVGIVSYNMYGNFTNYGSALQTWALQKAINSLNPNNINAKVVDYCPDILADKDVLSPIGNMWDTDSAAHERCRLSMPAIRENYAKFCNFYKTRYPLSGKKYTSANFNDSLAEENLDGYVCGSDTVFAVPEFGFDEGFYASYQVMRGRSVAFAASFGDWKNISDEEISELRSRLQNFNAIALRENDMLPLVGSLYNKPLYRVTDPTLLLTSEQYAEITVEPEVKEPYLLLYSRRHDPAMQEFAERKAADLGLRIIEISLNAKNAERHTMRYDAGVEEFLGLVKNAAMVVTNSFHGMIFAVQFRRPFYIFSRKLCDTKIEEMLALFGISDRLINTTDSPEAAPIDYNRVHSNIERERAHSLEILNRELTESI